MSAKFQNKGERDLFGQFQTADTKIRKKTKILLPDIKKSLNLSYETAIFISIGFVMSCIIFFSLGVEKGRQDTKGQVREGRHQGPLRESLSREKAAKARELPSSKDPEIKDAYAVQLAAFEKIDSAIEEQDRLRKRGYHADIKRVGHYYQLYVGGFDTKAKAQGALNKLKTNYKDCYIKKH